MNRNLSLKHRILLAALFLLVAALAQWALPDLSREGGGYGLYSLIPPAVAIALAFLTHDVLFALMMGVLAGGLVVGDINVLNRFMIPAIGSENYALILVVYLWCLGGLLGLWTRTGGARAFAARAQRGMVRGPRSAKLFAWLMGLVFHQGGSISTVLSGTTVRPVANAENVSHEELTYIVDSTGSPVATLIPLNIWSVYVGGFAAATVPILPDLDAAVAFFYRSLPLNFYAIFAVTMTFLLAADWLPWRGRRMRAAQERAASGGGLDRPGAFPLASKELSESRVPEGYRVSIVDFALPILTLIGFALGTFLATGTVWIGEAFGLAVAVAAGTAWLRGMQLRDVVGGIVDGCKGVTAGAILLGLAVTMGQVSKDLGTAGYIVETVTDWVLAPLLPALLLGICMVVAFSIGSSFGTFAVIVPLALPLAWSVFPDETFLSLCYASVIGGAVFGDQCSPISDTTILSSLACGADLMDHVRTQLPLALTAAGLAGVCATAVALLL